jgi:uncharacterized protein YndB with AHSA1/START domain/DNA-binding transcriptional ArsR family regulator
MIGAVMDEVFRALADPSRRALLDALHARGGQSLRELGEGLAMTRQAVAKHLGVLEAAGLVVTSWHGREKHHHLNAAPINDVADRWIRRYDRARAQTLADLKQALEETEMSDDFVYVSYIRTTPEKLWQALTDPAFIRRYYGGGGPTSDWQVGSPVLWSMGGEEPHDWDQHVLEADPPRRLSYTWHNYQPEMQEMFGWSDERLAELQQEKRSKVTFDIEPAGQAVKLTVTHDDFVPDSAMREGVSQGWPGILSNLKSLLETGEVVVD